MQTNLSIHKVRSMAEKRGDTCAGYLFSFMLIKQKFLMFKKGAPLSKKKDGRGRLHPTTPSPHCKPMYHH